MTLFGCQFKIVQGLLHILADAAAIIVAQAHIILCGAVSGIGSLAEQLGGLLIVTLKLLAGIVHISHVIIGFDGAFGNGFLIERHGLGNIHRNTAAVLVTIS